jgi:hypothetical protein
MGEVPGSNPIGKITFFIDKICPTVALVPTFFYLKRIYLMITLGTGTYLLHSSLPDESPYLD